MSTVTLYCFKARVVPYKERKRNRKMRSGFPPIYFKFRGILRRLTKTEITFRVRFRQWCDYLNDVDTPKKISRRELNALKNYNRNKKARIKLATNRKKLVAARRRSAIQKLETQFTNGQVIPVPCKYFDPNIINDTLYINWGTNKNKEYYLTGWEIVRWLNDNIGEIIDPPLNIHPLYGQGWSLNWDHEVRFTAAVPPSKISHFALLWTD